MAAIDSSPTAEFYGWDGYTISSDYGTCGNSSCQTWVSTNETTDSTAVSEEGWEFYEFNTSNDLCYEPEKDPSRRLPVEPNLPLWDKLQCYWDEPEQPKDKPRDSRKSVWACRPRHGLAGR